MYLKLNMKSGERLESHQVVHHVGQVRVHSVCRSETASWCLSDLRKARIFEQNKHTIFH